MQDNLMNEAYEYMLLSGSIDPAEVAHSDVQNATSIAAMILTIEQWKFSPISLNPSRLATVWGIWAA